MPHSDILAEMETFFPTRITTEQSVVPYPHGVYIDTENIGIFFEESMITHLYSTQIMFRILLNKAHSHIYSSTSKQRKMDRSHTMITLLTRRADNNQLKENEDTSYEPKRARSFYKLLNELRHFRKVLDKHPAAAMRWHDSEQVNQSSDLNIARMRAKYYGAEYMMSRPFLEYAIHCEEAAEKAQLEAAWRFAETLQMSEFDIFKKPHSIPSSVDERALRTVFACHKCITAALNSTYAFDKVDGRLMITNIFGTMHA